MRNIQSMWRAHLFDVISFKKVSFYLKTSLAVFAFSALSANLNAANDKNHSILTLKMAVGKAQINDPWLISNRHNQDSIESLSIASGTLPDPKVSLGLANIAADSFDFNQEAMTQFKVGVSQMFPRGDSLAFKQKQLEIIGSQFPIERKNRQARVAVAVSALWLDAYKAQQSIYLIEKDRTLFEQLADVAQASYSSAIGKTRQQDIVRAQLELTRLDDRLNQLRLKKEMSLQRLSEWLNNGQLNNLNANQLQLSQLSIDSRLPNIKMINQSLYTLPTQASQQKLYQLFSTHPAVQIYDKKIAASKVGVDIAKQKYKPEWGVNASYGFRDNDPMAQSRSDLFSVGISFDIPLFTGNRQDKQVQSAISETAAKKTDKWQFIRELMAAFETQRVQLLRLNERQALYKERLLPQMHNQAEASLTAYTNDDGDFAEVVRSKIAELNAAIDALEIDVERQKSIIQLNYFLMKNVSEITFDNQLSIQSLGEIQ